VGATVAVPKGTPVIDATDFVVMPGLVAARSHLGLASNWRRQSSIDEVSKAATPELEVIHAIEPQLPHFSYARQLGITTALVTPGDRNVIGGRGAVVKTVGLVVDRMIVKDAAVMMAGLGASAKRKDQLPSTRMGIAAVLRDTLVKAREYQEKLAAGEKEKDKGKESEFKRDLAMEALLPVLRAEMPVMIHCERRDDILTALRVADEFKLKVVLDGATDAWKVTDEIKARSIPVVLEDLYRGAGDVEDAGFNPRTPALLAGAGIPIAFRAQDAGSWYTPGAGESGGDLLEIAAFAFKHGLSEDAALRAVTIDAARVLGVENRVGSLEAGKDADLVILRGHPLLVASVPEAVIINGRLAYLRRDGAQLK
jgi:imidazolonepropionase-like amidohydrolase